ncbi:uncharacterized protein LOC134306895 isoform X1 [Trichomycterus rosablanca]|uniref:uncharacterized protein LOC134306895 isoform X1 n=1 Tax=Trichomycterus rosablanca TaxID=2290929 RepID=UPI002F353776
MNSNLNTGDVKPPQTPKLAWVPNQCFKNTEEIMLTDNTDMNDVELQTVEEEAMSPMIDNIPNVPLDEKTGLLEMEFHAKTEWFNKMEEKVKLKLEMDEVKQKRQKEIEDLKLEVKILKTEAKREKQEGETKLKDLEKEIKDEKSKVLLELKELKKKSKMEKKEERNRKRMEKHMKVDEEEHEVKDKQALKSKFRVAFKFRG